MSVLDRSVSQHLPIRNFLVKALYKIDPHTTSNIKPPDGSWNAYEEMHHLSAESFKKQITADYEMIFLTGNQPTLQHAFIALAQEIKKIWHTNWPCNILYADCDTLAVRSLEIFGRFRDFRMFSHRNPMNKTQYFNGGLKYFSSDIDDEFWVQLEKGIEVWNHDDYGYEQDLFTQLMWEQTNLDLNIPQSWVVAQGPWDNLEHASLVLDHNFRSIMHFHSTRNPEKTLNLMRQVWNKVTTISCK